MKNLLAAVTLLAMTVPSFATMTLYAYSDVAAKHCRSTVVWLNTKTGI